MIRWFQSFSPPTSHIGDDAAGDLARLGLAAIVVFRGILLGKPGVARTSLHMDSGKTTEHPSSSWAQVATQGSLNTAFHAGLLTSFEVGPVAFLVGYLSAKCGHSVDCAVI